MKEYGNMNLLSENLLKTLQMNFSKSKYIKIM